MHTFCTPPVALASPLITAYGHFLVMHTLLLVNMLLTRPPFISHEGWGKRVPAAELERVQRGSRAHLFFFFFYMVRTQKVEPIMFTLRLSPTPIRSSEGRQSVNSPLRRVGHVVLYFLSEVERMSPRCSCLRKNKRERKQ